MKKRFFVYVFPGAKKNRLELISENVYQAELKAPARQGMANQLLRFLLADYFKLDNFQQVKILGGFRRSKKLIEINLPD